MSARIPTRRAGQCALAPLRPSSIYWISSPVSSTPFTTRRYLTNPLKRLGERLRPKKPATDLSNPTLLKLLKKREEDKKKRKEGALKEPQIDPGELSTSTTIFKPDYEIPGWRDDLDKAEQERLRAHNALRRKKAEKRKDAQLSSLALDPNPRARQMWERRMVIRSLRRRGRLTKDQRLARTERQSLFKSQNLPTSVKKLTKIMNQIQGKTVEEALVQLRFSKKRVARDVLKGLQIARNHAVIARGMGFGRAIVEKEQKPTNTKTALAKAEEQTNEELDKEKETRSAKEVAREAYILPDGTRLKHKSRKGTTIELKDGSRKQIQDPTEIYIDQAWVGKGEKWQSPEFRARGRINMLTHRTTSFSVLLKEEKTRMRISDEIQKKRANRKLWNPLPDRPITSQRQYCLW